MNDISQTKEGFIKSMILFIVLLSVCFAPFFAFAQTSNTLAINVVTKRGISVIDEVAFVEESNNIEFNVLTSTNRVFLDFKTEFTCFSYSLEAIKAGETEFKSVSYCHDAKCADAMESVNYSLNIQDVTYTDYRVKAVKSDGTVIYSEVKHVTQKPAVQDVELLNTAVNDLLLLKLNSSENYTYSISNIKGEELKHGETNCESNVQVNDLSVGFYTISFVGANGNKIHYSFYKTINL